jgi:hypothetical protein
MTITFENDNDIIVYALEKIISFARDNHYIFLAQSIWWISSIIGLQPELVIHIDNLRNRSNQGDRQRQGSEPASKASKPDNYRENSCSRAVSSTPRDLQEESRNRIDYQQIHPDRIRQVNCSELTDHLNSVLKEAEELPRSSQAKRKRFDPLRHTRQGKVQPHKLAKKERKRLNKIIQESPDSVRKFIN